MKEIIYSDPEIGDVRFVKSSRSRRISIRVSPDKGVRVTVPAYMHFDEGRKFYFQKHDWVVATVRRQQQMRRQTEDPALQEALANGLIEKMRARAKMILPAKTAYLAHLYGFKFNKVFIKHNKTNWGSCSTLGNINLNLNLVRLPEPVYDYIILHELTHLKHMNHGPEFHELLEKLCRENLLRLAEAGNPDAPVFIAAAQKSRTQYPFSNILKAETKKYRLL